MSEESTAGDRRKREWGAFLMMLGLFTAILAATTFSITFAVVAVVLFGKGWSWAGGSHAE